MSFFQGLSSSNNLSYFAVPAAWVCAHAPHIYTIIGTKAYNNSNPQAFKDNIAKSSRLDEKTKQHYIRAKNASQNNYETLGLFAAGVAAANAAGVDVPVLNYLSWGYIAARILYNCVYIFFDGEDMMISHFRSLVWSVGMFHSMGQFVAAGIKAMKA